MQSGFSFSQTLALLENQDNHQAIQNVQKGLEQGNTAEDCFAGILPKAIQANTLAFLRFVSLEKALQLALHLEEYDQQTRRHFFKSLIGPFFLFVGSLIGIQLFFLFCFPILINLMASFELEMRGWEAFRKIFYLGICIFLVILLMISSLTLYMIRPKRIVLAYLLLCRMHLEKPFCLFLSTQFAVYFNECAKSGNSTQLILQMLQQLKQKPLIVFLAYHVEQSLLQGNPVEEAMSHAYLDSSLRRFMQIAVHSSSLKAMLDSYITQNEEKGKQLCRIWSRRLTTAAYAGIGILIILIYEILFLPLSILGQV